MSALATSKSFFDYILDQLSDLEDISHKMMMGEYIIYYRGKIAAYVCDNRLLVKPVEAAAKLIPNAVYEPPYEGAKDMILVDDIDSREHLTELFEAMYDQLPEPKPKKSRKKASTGEKND